MPIASPIAPVIQTAAAALIPDSPDGLGRQDRRPRKRWRNCQFLLSPVGSVGIRLLDPASEFDLTAEIGAQSWPNAISSGESGLIPFTSKPLLKMTAPPKNPMPERKPCRVRL